jgi:aspartokinase-like uncharacterized kinase
MNEAILVPGGGATAEMVRRWDRCHGLGEEAAHWLALQALSLNARFLASLLPAEATEIVSDLEHCSESWRLGRTPIIDLYAVARADDGRPGCLPHCWAVTSDSLAARIAFLVRARQLLLLKSTSIPERIDWAEASRRGFVDPFFAALIREIQKPGQKLMEVRAINFRNWPAKVATCE